MSWAVYGAYGYTGRLVVERALEAGEQPLLLGRDADALAALARRTGLPHQSLSLDDRAGLAAVLRDLDVVAHCAGPFRRTSRLVVDACLDTGTHYVDVTGEIAVLEAVLERSDEAVTAGVALLPGSGFDVVPTDCAAALVAERLEGLRELRIAFVVGGGPSRGTALTAVEGLAGGGRARVGGRITDVPRERRRWRAPLPSGTRPVVAVPWGDVSTATRSTGASEVTCYTLVPGAAAEPLLRATLRLPGAGRVAAAAVSRVIRGPDEDARSRTTAEVVVEGRTADGLTARVALRAPNAYGFTADSVLAVVGRLRDGEVPPGAHTPAQAHGARFVLSLPGVELVGG